MDLAKGILRQGDHGLSGGGNYMKDPGLCGVGLGPSEGGERD